MNSNAESVFFYGLFMDKSILVDKGLNPSNPEVAYAQDYCLKIGMRATLIPNCGRKAYGVIMTLSSAELEKLYSEPSLRDYKPMPIEVVDASGNPRSISSYLLVEDELSDCNTEYARALLDIARKLALPQSYLQEIEPLTE